MVEGVIVIDGYGTILRANDRVAETFGLERRTVRSRGLRLWDLSRDVEFNARRARGAREPAPDGARGRAARRDPASPEGDRRSRPADGSAWVLVFHDVTETKRLERVRTDFVANVSHELRTPLTAIKGFAETLARAASRTAQRAAHSSRSSTARPSASSRLIDDLLILSDLELGKMPVRVRPVAAGADRARGRRPAVGAGTARRRRPADRGRPRGLRVQGDPRPPDARWSRTCSTTRSSTRPTAGASGSPAAVPATAAGRAGRRGHGRGDPRGGSAAPRRALLPRRQGALRELGGTGLGPRRSSSTSSRRTAARCASRAASASARR